MNTRHDTHTVLDPRLPHCRVLFQYSSTVICGCICIRAVLRCAVLDVVIAGNRGNRSSKYKSSSATVPTALLYLHTIPIPHHPLSHKSHSHPHLHSYSFTIKLSIRIYDLCVAASPTYSIPSVEVHAHPPSSPQAHPSSISYPYRMWINHMG